MSSKNQPLNDIKAPQIKNLQAFARRKKCLTFTEKLGKIRQMDLGLPIPAALEPK